MLQEPFPDDQPDDPEPDGSGPAADNDAPGPEQGLYVTLPTRWLALIATAPPSTAGTIYGLHARGFAGQLWAVDEYPRPRTGSGRRIVLRTG